MFTILSSLAIQNFVWIIKDEKRLLENLPFLLLKKQLNEVLIGNICALLGMFCLCV